MLAAFPNYTKALEILRDANPSDELLERALRLAGVMRSLAKLREHDELSEGWAAAGLLYHPEAGLRFPEQLLTEAGANHGFLTLLKLTEVPPLGRTPTASQELACLLVTAAPLVRIILEMIHTQNCDLHSLKVSAVQKRFADKTFLPSVSRSHILDGSRALHWEIGNLTSKIIGALREDAPAVKSALRKAHK